jgi:hypothetical protein
MPNEIQYADIIKSPAKVVGIVTFEVEVSTEIQIDTFIKTGDSADDFQAKARMALMDEAKKKVAKGNCQARIVGLDIKLI